MDISIVSGTYNRQFHLRKMAESVRQSIKFSLSYEIVIVDGGSRDDTINYCNHWPDINLIEQGKLLGAVKAFNDGAFAAKGDYVILANDDIEFIKDSIYQAWLFMQLHPDCGMGCFYQDRDRQDENKWHVSKMPVVKNGKQFMDYYGQVCIVPKWLGDKVHWWCNPEEYIAKSVDYNDENIVPLHTYAGDNELSSQVYDLGYQVLPIERARIHDNVVLDDLRKFNNIWGGDDPRAVQGHHPDSYSWARKWRMQGKDLTGAIVKNSPQVDNQMNYKPRVLYLPIYEPGWEIQKEQKRGLREALERVGLCIEYDYWGQFNAIGKDGIISAIVRIIKEIHPTLILTQLHNGDILDHNDIAHLRRFARLAKFFNWNGDYYPEQLLSDEGLELARSFDLMTSVNRDVVDKQQRLGINTEYWQIGYEPAGVIDKPTIQHDVVFLASGYSKERQKLGGWLRSLNLNFGLYGNGWQDDWSKGENLYNFKEAAGIYLGAKISIGDSQWPDSGFVSNRVMQALVAGGSVLAHQWFRGMEHLGLIDGQTCIIWNDYNDLEHKIRHYLANEGERVKIAESGQKLAFKQHSFDTRVRELFEMIEPKETSGADWRW